ncbi:PGPGW domain-containing protein [bacterium]|nr:PGPGW domain-containing protein [bacterium]MBU1153597.1 PGPGW domain-containing protein [bacterium]MBU1782033.1 PGPGW domain-containing protein [bacterium]
MIQVTYKFLRRLFIIIIGFTIFLLGLVMLFLPGPGLAVIIIGLSILALEVVWARLLLKWLKNESKAYTRGFVAWLRKHCQLVLPKDQKGSNTHDSGPSSPNK